MKLFTRILFFLAFLFFHIQNYAQNQANNWYFGNFAGITFNSGTPVALTNSAMSMLEGCASISDSAGNLLFYTDGMTVWNRIHAVMTNGSGLMGNSSSTQSGVIVPHPVNLNLFYLFTTDACHNGLANGLRYSIVDMSIGTHGAVTATKNVLLTGSVSEKVTAVKHCNNVDIWVITHKYNSNQFYAYIITSSGLNTTPVISSVGTVHQGGGSCGFAYPNVGNARGYLKVSSNGSKMALAITYDGNPANTGSFELFDFDYVTGQVSNPLKFTGSDYYGAYGIEFSPDRSKLYACTWGAPGTSNLFQWDLEAGSNAAIIASRRLIATSSNGRYGGIQLGPNAKIYIAKPNTSFLDVINDPNESGSLCNYQVNGVSLSGRTCQYGLPTFIQSYFDPGFTVTNIFLGDSTMFVISDTSRLDSVRWYFDDPVTGQHNTSSQFNPVHLYSDTGQYDVTLILYKCYGTVIDTLYRPVTIHPTPFAGFTVNDSTQCLTGNNFIFTNTSTILSGTMTYLWNFDDGTNSVLTNPTHNYINPGTYKVTLTATSDKGKKHSVSKNVYVFQMPNAGYTTNSYSQCLSNNGFNFINTSSISSGTLSYLWNFGDGTTSTNTNPNHMFLSAGTYNVVLTATSDNSCIDSISKNIYIRPMPAPDFTINDSDQCFSGNSFVFTNTTPALSGPISYIWRFGDGDSSSANNPSHSYSNPGTYIVELEATSSYNCVNTITKKVYVRPHPVAQFSINNNAQCINNNVFIFTNQSILSSGTASYLWNFGDGKTSTALNPIHTYASAGSFQVLLIVISNYGCSDSISKTVLVNPKPNAGFTVNNPNQCENNNSFVFTNTSSISSGTLSYSWIFDDGNTSSASNPTHVYINDGSYNVLLIAQSNQACQDTASLTINVYPKPEPNFSINNSSQCLNNNNVVLTNTSSIPSGTMTYFWKLGDGITSTNTHVTHSYAADGNYSVVLTATSNHSCVDSITRTVRIRPMPDADFTINNNAQCQQGNSFVFTNNSTISSGTITYLWDFGDGITSTSNNPSHTYTSSGSFQVKLMVTSNRGCQDSVIKSITVYPMPEANFTINASSQCLSGNSFVFTNTSGISSGTVSYTWNFGDGNTSSVTNPIHSYAASGNYSVKLIVSSNNACLDSIQRTVRVRPMPNADFTINNNAQCLNGNNFSFTNNSTVSSGTINYVWQFGDGNQSTATNPIHSYISHGTFQVKLIASTAYNCSDSITKSLNVHPMPQANFSINDTVQCFTSNSFIYTNTSTLSSGSMTYFWNLGDASTSASTHVSHSYAANGYFQVTLVATSNNNCKDSITKIVHILPLPVADFTINNNSQCLSNNSFIFTDASTSCDPILQYNWDLNNDGIFTDATGASITHNFSSAGLYSVGLQIITAFDTTVRSRNINVRPMPNAAFSVNDPTQCLSGNSFQLTNNSSITSGTLSYQWTFGDGNSSSATNPSHSYAGTGAYTITLIAVSNYQCRDTVKSNVNTYPMPQADFVVNNNSQCLNNNNFSFTNNSTIPSGTVTYLWRFGDGNTSVTANPTHTYAVAGNYQVTLILTSNRGCQDSITKNVSVNAMPVADFTINNNSQCLTGNNYSFTNASTISAGTMSYIWYFGDGNTSTATNPSHNYAQTGTYQVKLVVSSGFGCEDSIVKNVNVRPMPQAIFSVNDTTQCFTSNNFIFNNLSSIASGSLSYAWFFGDGNNSSATNPIHQYNSDGTFQVKLFVTSNYNCIDSAILNVHVLPLPEADFVINDSSQCLTGNSFSFSDNSTSCDPVLQYRWDFDNNGLFNDASGMTVSHSFASADTYYVGLQIITAFDTVSTYKVVIVYPMPDADFTINTPAQCLRDNSFSFTNTSSISSGSITALWDFNDGNTSLLNNPVHSYVSHDTFAVELRVVSDQGCPDSITKNVYVHPMPQAAFSVNDSDQCLSANNFIFNNQSSLPWGSMTYSWDFGDASSSGSANPSHSYAAEGIFSVKMTATSALGCIDSIRHNMYVQPMPQADFTINDSSQCLDVNNFMFTNNSSIAFGTIDYFWNLGDATTSTQTHVSHTYATHASYQVKLVANSGQNCKDSMIKTVFVNPMPQAAFTVNDSMQGLTGNNFIFTNTSAIVSGTIQYFWDFDDGSTSTQSNPSHSYTSEGTYYVKLLVTSDKGCQDSFVKIVYVMPPPRASFSINDSAQCLTGNLFVFRNITSTFDPILFVLWDLDEDGIFNDASGDSTGNIYGIADTFRVGMRIITAFDTSDAFRQVIVHPMPQAAFTINDTEQCLNGNNFVFTNNSQISSGNLSYIWYFGDGTSSPAANPNHIYSYRDTFEVKLRALSAYGCPDSASNTIVVHPKPNADFTIDDPSQCFKGNSFLFTNSTSIDFGTLNYFWDFDDGSSAPGQGPFTHTYPNYDTFRVKLIAYSDLNCTDSIIKEIYVHPMPVSDFSMNDSAQCLSGNNFQFNNNSLIPYGTLTHVWNFGDGQSSNLDNPLHSYSTDDTFSVKLWTTSGQGCQDSTFKTSYVHPMPLPAYMVNDTAQCLNGNAFAFYNTSAIKWGTLSYRWDFDDGNQNFSAGPVNHVFSYDDTFYVEILAVSQLGCRDSFSRPVYVHPMPVADFDLNDSMQCARDNKFFYLDKSVSKSGAMNYLWDFGDHYLSTLKNPQHSYLDEDTFLVSLTVSTQLGLCNDTIAKFVYVHPSPVAGFTVSDTFQCFHNNSFSFTDTSSVSSGNLNYVWTFGDGDSSLMQNPVHSYNEGNIFFVKHLVITDLGCRDSLRSPVYVQKPVADFSINDSSQCLNGNNYVFSNTTSSNMSDTFSWFWNFGDLSVSAVQNPQYSYNSANTYQVSLLAVSGRTCRDSVSKQVYVRHMPSADFTTNDTTQCLSANSFIFNNTSKIASADTLFYIWDFGDGMGSLDTHTSHVYTLADSFHVSLQSISEYGCRDTSRQKVYVYPSPLVQFTVNDSTQCFSSNHFVFSNNSSLGTDVLNHQWYFGDGNTSSLGNPDHSYNTFGTYTVNLVSTSSNNCSDSFSRNVHVFASPVTDFTISDTLQCQNNNRFIFTNTSNIASGDTVWYNWAFGDGNTVNYDTNTNHQYGYADTFSVRLLGITKNLCIDSTVHKVYVLPAPQSDFSVNDTDQCMKGHSFVFTNTSITNGTNPDYLWNFGDGNTSLLKDPSHKYNTVDTFVVSLVATAANSCTDTFSKSVYVFSSPLSLFSINDSVQCFNGHNFVFANNTVFAQGDSMSYIWDFGDGNSIADTNASHMYVNDGNYKVTLLSSTQKGCVDSMTRNVWVHPMPVAAYSVNDTAQCFQGNSFSFANNSSISSGAMTYAWHFGDGSTTTSPNPLHNYSLDGTYMVKIVATSLENCSDSFERRLYVYPQPQADFAVNQPCFGDTTFFINSSIVNDINPVYLWDFGNGDTSMAFSPFLVYDSVGTYNVILHIMTSKFCYDSIIKTITVSPIPLIQLIGDSIFDPVNFNPFSVKGNFDSVYWSNGDMGSNTLITDTGIYMVEVVDINTCRNSKLFRVIPRITDECVDLLQMNLITPNQDGINDKWVISNLINVKPVEVNIYNRWGEQVYQNSNYNDDWEGLRKGEPLTDGTYYFIVRTGDNKVCKGAVNILR